MKQYIDKTKIEEILRSLWKKDDGNNSEHRICYNKALQEVQCQLDTLEVDEEPVSNDLEAEFVLYLKHKFHIPQEGNTLKTDGWSPSPYDILDIAKHFANWQKEQMMKDAVETTVSSMVHQLIVTDYIIVNAEQFGLKKGDKVKVLIIKEE